MKLLKTVAVIAGLMGGVAYANTCTLELSQTKPKQAIKICTDVLNKDINNAKASYHLAVAHEAVDDDYIAAVVWYLNSARKGYAPAQTAMGRMFHYGYGVEQDYKEAFDYYTKAAKQNDAEGQYWLGVMYYEGTGVKQDYKKAFDWFLKSANQGDADAQNDVAVFYREGYGVKQDYKKALEWYQKAANQGNSYAQNGLGSMYHFGMGVKKTKSKQLSGTSSPPTKAMLKDNIILGICIVMAWV